MHNPSIPAHPSWCDPRCCRTTDTDVEHNSAPVLVRTADADYTVWQHRADELAHPETWNDPSWLEVQITSRVAAADGWSALSLSASLRPGELLALVGALTSAMAPGVTP